MTQRNISLKGVEMNRNIYKLAKTLSLDKKDVDAILSNPGIYKAGTSYDTVSCKDLYKACTDYGTVSIKDF